MRKLATVEKILDVQPIEGADSIEKVQVRGWWCVAKKGEFKVGDPCVYFEIDSLLPSGNPAFEFLSKGNKEKVMNLDGREYKGYRLRTIKLRGQISQGLALPISSVFTSDEEIDNYCDVGNDVSDVLGIVKYEPPIPAQLAGKIKGQFPGFLRKTDEERVQNLSDELPNFKGIQCYVTEKLDGTSATYYKKEGVFGVCSRNLDLLDTPGNTHWEIARKYDLANKLPDGYAIQGEIIGEGIQGNPLKIQGQDFYCYNVYKISESRYLDYAAEADNTDNLFEFCQMLGVKLVPVLNVGTFGDAVVEDWLLSADGKSVLCETADREGIVIRPVVEKVMQVNGQSQRMSFKAISNTYLLSHDS